MLVSLILGLVISHVGHAPSEESDAPDNLNSSLPIWIGNTLSRGSIGGILWMFFSLGGTIPAWLPGRELGVPWVSEKPSLGLADAMVCRV